MVVVNKAKHQDKESFISFPSCTVSLESLKRTISLFFFISPLRLMPKCDLKSEVTPHNSQLVSHNS